MKLDDIKTWIGLGSTTIALIVGGQQAYDKLLASKKPILEWAPEYFHISDGPANGEFTVVVARKKLRDDCAVEQFKLEIRDSQFIVHPATPSLATFSGPASGAIDKFGYRMTIEQNHAHDVSLGEATLIAHIKYKCPEGEVIVNYPKHPNLQFQITKG